ncbi:GFA family protein [Streptomyces sp. RM72]|uniref:GFA family protein n=1 Tax=unclassified Streptomyces TaxID=2593676 RepID=UPI001B3889E7|nr:GFA family protein [Streptomyces sp. RM72]MBQ0890477.1 GFA family protein [Streptomyces sp. RM72]
MTTTDSSSSSALRCGGCLCGAVRFEVPDAPDAPHLCSCRHCQKLSGGPVMSWVCFPLAGLVWIGREPVWFYTYPHETRRGRCPDCGSQLCALDDGATSIAFNFSALDDSSDLVPAFQSYAHDAVSWLRPVTDTRPTAAAGS